MKSFKTLAGCSLALFWMVFGASAQGIYKEYHVNYSVASPNFNDCLKTPDECNDAGEPIGYKASFMPKTDDVTPFPNRLKFEIEFNEYSGKLPNFFWFILSAGEMPDKAGAYAEIVVDASKDRAVISVYAYNGGHEPSWKSGAAPANGQTFAPDRIISDQTPGWAPTLDIQENGAGTYRKFILEMDTTPILEHVPAYGDPIDPKKNWKGSAYGPGFGLWLHPAIVDTTQYDNDGFLFDWNIHNTGQLEKNNGKVAGVCEFDCEGNELVKGKEPAVCPTPTPETTPTATPTATLTPTPTPTATATPTPSVVPTDPVTPFGCTEEDNTEILVTIDSVSAEVAKIAKKSARAFQKLGGSKRAVKRTQKLVGQIVGLGIEAWTQGWSIPTVTTQCLTFSSADCTVEDFQPFRDRYNEAIGEMQGLTRIVLRNLKKLNKRRAGKLSRALTKNVQLGLDSSMQLAVTSVTCS